MSNGEPASDSPRLPETPHELHVDRGLVDELVNRARAGEHVDLLTELLRVVDWTAFTDDRGRPLDGVARGDLKTYYLQKWSDIGTLYLAELLSTEFMTEQRARGDVVFSDRLLQLGRNEPELWQEIRQFFRRKEMVTAMLMQAHDPGKRSAPDPADDEEEDLWE